MSTDAPPSAVPADAVGAAEGSGAPRHRPGRLIGFLSGAVAIALVVIGATYVLDRSANEGSAQRNVSSALQRPVVSAEGLRSLLGIRVTKVSVSGGGGLVDLRFLVVDPNLAGRLHEVDRPPEIIDESTGVVVNQLLMGHSHSEPFKAGVTYYLIFENPANWVRRGGQVTILLGDAQVEHVVVS
jgi:hypothetical protein